MTMRCLALAVFVSAACAAEVLASDISVQGLKMRMSDVTQPGYVRRTALFRSGEISIPIPPAGSPGDPTVHGGSLRLVNIAGSGEDTLLVLPASYWRRIPSEPTRPVLGWKFKLKVSNPPVEDYIVTAMLKTSYHLILKAVVRDKTGSVLSYTLDEPMQGAIEGQLSLGAQRICAAFDTAVKSDVSNDLGGGGYRGTFSAGLNGTRHPCASPSGAILDASL